MLACTAEVDRWKRSRDRRGRRGWQEGSSSAQEELGRGCGLLAPTKLEALFLFLLMQLVRPVVPGADG